MNELPSGLWSWPQKVKTQNLVIINGEHAKWAISVHWFLLSILHFHQIHHHHHLQPWDHSLQAPEGQLAWGQSGNKQNNEKLHPT